MDTKDYFVLRDSREDLIRVFQDDLDYIWDHDINGSCNTSRLHIYISELDIRCIYLIDDPYKNAGYRFAKNNVINSLKDLLETKKNE